MTNRKFLLIFLIFIQVVGLKAEEANSWVTQLDKKKISTGYLLNIAPFIDFSDFLDSNFTSNKKNYTKPLMYDKRKWRLLYASLVASKINIKDSILPLTALSDFSNEIYDKKNPIIPIGIIDFSTNFVSDTLSPNDSKIQKIRVSAIAALQSKVYNKNVTFKIKPEYYFSNRKRLIKSVDVDFGDGSGFLSYSTETDQSIKKTYSSVGEKSIHLRIYRGKDTLNYFSKIEVIHLALPTPDQTLNISSTPINDIKGTSTNSNFRSSARIDVPIIGGSAFVYLGCDNVLDKPFYIVEGFDPANTNDLGFHLQNDQFGGYSLFTLANRGYDVTWSVSPDPNTGVGSINIGGGLQAWVMYFPPTNSNYIYPGQYTISCTIRASGSNQISSSSFVVQIQTSQCTDLPFGLRKEVSEDSPYLVESANLDFYIFPNPSQGKIQLQFNQHIDSEVTVEIVGMNGSVQKDKRKVSSNMLRLDMEIFSEGVYQLRISNDKLNKTEKLVII